MSLICSACLGQGEVADRAPCRHGSACPECGPDMVPCDHCHDASGNEPCAECDGDAVTRAVDGVARCSACAALALGAV